MAKKAKKRPRKHQTGKVGGRKVCCTLIKGSAGKKMTCTVKKAKKPCIKRKARKSRKARKA